MESDSIFTMIVNKEIPSLVVHEDSFAMAIMDINPIQTGQILVFPKKQIPTVWDLAKEDYQALMDVVQQAGQQLKKLFPAKLVGVMVEGLEVKDHAHVKVFPFASAEEYHAQARPADPESLKQLAEQLRF